MNTNLFYQAHSLTKAILRVGDNYQATFGLCLAYLYKLGKKNAKKFGGFQEFLPL